MFKPVDMVKLNVLLLEKHVDRVTRALGASGFVHLVNAVAQSQHRLLHGVDRGEALRRTDTLLQHCRELMARLSIAEETVPDSGRTLDFAAMEALLAAATRDFQAEEEALDRLVEEEKQHRETLAAVFACPVQTVSFRELRGLNHFYLATGRVTLAALPEVEAGLAGQAVVLHDPAETKAQEDVRVLVLAPSKRRSDVEAGLTRVGFKVAEMPADLEGSGHEEQQRLATRLDELREAIAARQEAIRQLGRRYGAGLAAAHGQLRQALAIVQAQQQFGQAAEIFCLFGWMPSARREEARRLIREASDGTGIVEFVRPDEDDLVRAGSELVPVQFAGSAVMRPFQAILTTFGAPRYEEIEPSLFVAVSFLLMFGIMFGDLGQGMVLVAAGSWFLLSRQPRLVRIRDAGYLLVACGLSASFFGILYGSVFGSERLWHRVFGAPFLLPLRDVMTLFKAAIVIGIVCISISLIINILNKFRTGHYFDGLVSRSGLVGLLFYWGSIGLGVKALVARRVAWYEVVAVIAVPLLLLLLREPLHAVVTRQKHWLHDDIFTFVMISLMEVLETVTTFLGNTVSFIRVGAFALSHAALCMAIFIIADMLHGLPGGGVLQVLAIILGNVFVMVLEGMVATIQGIRLQYYELFSKYFVGDGILYSPFQLDTAAVRTANKEKQA